MRRLILGMAMATTALATPALARDKSWYVEGDAGGVIVENQTFIRHSTGSALGTLKDRVGYDFGGVIGYDFGMFRLETEASYRRAKDKSYTTAAGTTFDHNTAHAIGGGNEALSFMMNGLVDFGPDDEADGSVRPGRRRAGPGGSAGRSHPSHPDALRPPVRG